MTKSKAIENDGSTFTKVLEAAAKLPGVRINREAYLRSSLRRFCSEEQIEQAIATSPAAAGIPQSVVYGIANTAIKFETSKATGLSAAAGVPGGVAAIATTQLDVVQYFGHVLRIAQKLAYLYSWPDLFPDDGSELDEATEGILTLFVGVMFGVQLAQAGVSKVSTMIASQVAKKLPQQALTKGTIYPIVKKVAGLLGVQMTKKIFANGLAKVVPVVGAALSGGLTLATFLPMAKRLQKHLAGLSIATAHPTGTPDDILDAEVVEADDGAGLQDR